MVQSQFSLSWDSYKTSVCSGFSTLQQNGEFVDMTLAADGHFVKVHQVLVALASPYLKDLITSAQCPHPVIVLNNVSNRTLSLLLEYIYTGEVLVRADNLTTFAETAKALHIRGLENITANETVKSTIDLPLQNEKNICQISSVEHVMVPTIETKQITRTSSGKRIFIKKENVSIPSLKPVSIKAPKEDNMHEYGEMMDDSSAAEDNEIFVQEYSTPTSNMENNGDEIKASSNIQFTVSIRGSLQMILNRYIYNLNSTTTRAGLRRWRCVNYRNNKCTAFVITKGNVVLKRANLHNHSFHDKKILAKMEKKAVFSALDEIEGYKERELRRGAAAEDQDMSMDNDHYTLDDLETEMNEKTSLLVRRS